MIYKGPGNPPGRTLKLLPPLSPQQVFALSHSSFVSPVEHANEGGGGGGGLVCEKSQIVRRQEILVIQYSLVYIESLREHKILYLCHESYIVCKENIRTPRKTMVPIPTRSLSCQGQRANFIHQGVLNDL
jgi:hypothetical protein